MALDDLLASLFPDGHDVAVTDGIVSGSGRLGAARTTVIGVDVGTPLGVEGALALAGAVLDAVDRGDRAPIVVLIDSGSQRMRRRDEMLGLSEFLAHLAKSLRLADAEGHPTIGLIHGHSAAGAFIATALATRVLAALPSANPTVMDLPSMARVTTLPLERLEKLAEGTPVFAPGIDNMVAVGAVHSILDPERSLAEQLEALLADLPARDLRDRLGAERGGRPKAAEIAARIVEAARAG
jgi:malonate decarboxylase gamma subunit